MGLVWDISLTPENHFSLFVLLGNFVNPFSAIYSRKFSFFSFARDTSPDIPDSFEFIINPFLYFACYFNRIL